MKYFHYIHLFNLLANTELDVIVPPSTLNPFCSSLPSRIPTGFAMKKFNNSAAVMSNDYICVVRVIGK